MADSKVHLRRIQLSGFKSIKALDLEMNTINILIGANGSGKSNFISLFTFLRNLSVGKLQTYIEKSGFANTFFHFGSKTTKKMIVDIDFGTKGYGVAFIHGEANDALVFEQEYCAESVPYKSHFKKEKRNIKGALGESGLLSGSDIGDVHIKRHTREFMQKCRVYHFHDTSPTAEFKKAQKLTANVDLQSDASNIAPYLYRLKQDYANSYREIVSAIQTVAPFFHDFYLVPRGETGDESLLLRWFHRDHDAPFSANQLSDGTARFICMATLFLQPESIRPNTIILDEPELGLHPAALEVLAEMIKSISKKTQIICSTQSATFANFFQPEDFIVVDQEKGISKFSRLDNEALEVWLDEYGMGDIWMKNLIGGRPEW